MNSSRLLTTVLAILLFGGSGGAIDVASPSVPPEPTTRAKPVAAGAAHSLAIAPDGTVWAWGDNLAGQLGTGDRAARTAPATVTGLTGSYVAVSAGAGHSLALRVDGSVWSWGMNLDGQLGDGTNRSRTVPVQVAGLNNVVAIAAGGGHSLAATADGSVWAWGGNFSGQVGDGTSGQRRRPVRVTTISDVIAVEAGVMHSVALKADGTVWAWGANLTGQVGDGTRTVRRRPVKVLNIAAARSIAAGAFHNLAVTETGSAWGWGLNLSGQLGDGTTETRTRPALIGGLPPISLASAGGGHSVALDASGAAFGWGDNSTGQVGDRSSTRRLTAVPMAQPPTSWVALAAGGAHTIGLAPDASVWAWGNNLLGQLGDSTRTRRLQPAPISGPQAAWGVYPPQFTPTGGTYTAAVSVTLSTPTPNAIIHYTTSGAEPTTNDPIFAGVPLSIEVSMTLKALAVRPGMTPSAIVSSVYTFDLGSLNVPIAVPPGGAYPQPQSVVLTADEGATIRYSLDGSEPGETATLYATPITLASTTTLKARAFRSGYAPSAALTADYVIQTGPPPGEVPPPDPATVAPPLPDAVLTDFAGAQAFLFSGADPIQREVQPDALKEERLAVVRGRVLARDGQPLAGARVSAPEQPTVGHTVSRDDGMFDLAVNGGGPVLIEYTRAGFLPAQPTVETPWQDFASAPDVRLVQLDPVVTRVSFAPQSISTAARGSVSTDDNGSRQATLIIPETGVMATIHLPDGTMMPGVSQLSLRATEYTVGTGGPQAMPGSLPATSGYTYAVELTADEVLQAGATTVTFDPPLALYVENFLNFPVGGAAPVGYYDRARSAWVPSDDGRVIGVVGINAAGEADLDVDGSGQAADAETLAALGVTSGERRRVALLYAPGQSLWRAPIPHFTPWDINWPFGAPQDAQPPNLDTNNEGPKAPGTRSTQRTGLRPGADGQADKPCNESGSIVECQNQTLGELLPIAGTPFTLAYRSDRVPGYSNPRTLAIPLTTPTVSASLKRVELDVTVAGQKHTFEFAPTPGQSTSFTWNGLDAYGRPRNGQQLATATVSHVYDGVYYAGPVNFERSFATPPAPNAPVVANVARGEISFPQSMVFAVEARHPAQAPIAGWYISSHHRYDAQSRVLFMGDGDQRTAAAVGDVIDTVAGGGETPVEAAPVPAREAQLTGARAVAATADGSIYFTANGGVHRLAAGMVTRIVTSQAGDEGGVDFNPSVAARGELAVYSYGDVEGNCAEGGYFTALRVRRLLPTGPGEELAAIPLSETIPCSYGTHVAIGTDGGFFLGSGTTVWAIRPGANPVVIAADLGAQSLAAGPAGSLYIGTGLQVRQWRPDGSLHVVAGNGTFGNSGDGGPALDAPLGSPYALVADGEGNILIASDDSNATRIRVVRANGTIEWYAGGVNSFGLTDDGSAGRNAQLLVVLGMALTPDGSLVLSNNAYGGSIMRLRLPFDATRVPSGDGASVYEFDLSGRHLRTVDALTGIALLTFAYDGAGRLTGISDRDGLETRLIRDGAGVPQSVVSPFGVATTLTIGAGGYLAAVTDAEGNTTTLGYGDGGLLTSLRDTNGGVYAFDYDTGGRLLRDADPAGGAQDLSRSNSGNGWTVTRDVSDAGTTTYVTQQGTNGTQTRRVIAPDGTETVSLNRGDGSTVMTAPDGTQTTATLAPDPRFGLAAPVAASTTVRTPAGLTMTVATSRSVTLANPDNPLSVVSHTETTTLNGRVSRSVFDAAARTITNTSPANRQTVTTLDASGRPVSVQVGTLLPTTFAYDGFGRLATQTQGARTTSFVYDDRAFVSEITDPLARTVRFTNDGLGRRTEQTFPDGRIASFAFDGNSNLTSLTPPGRPAHAMSYNPVNQLEQYTAPDAGSGAALTRYEFNLAKQPTRVTRADSQVINWTYDGAGRPTTLSTPTGDTTYAYHATSGQLTAVTTPSTTLTYTYDGSLQTAETFAGPVNGAVSWSYDHNFRVTSERVRAANEITFAYDADSLLTRTGTLTYTRRASDGLLLTAAIGATPTTTTFTYSGFGELATEETRRGATVFYRGVYTRDDGGRLAEKTETIGGVATVEAYSYDLAGRLTGVSRGGAPVAGYTYDLNGNRTSVTTPAGTVAATYDDQDRILTLGGRTYTHTAHGEVASWTESGATTTLSYDVQGNLLAVGLPTGTLVQYEVDGRNRRLRRLVNGAATHGFLYQGQLRPIAELDGAGTLVSRFVYGARAVAPEYLIRGGVTYRLVTDHLGSVRLVVNTTSGAIIQRLDYDAFGKVTLDTNPGFQPFGYAGGLYDPLTGFVRFGARDYEPTSARWLTKDPVGFGGGDSNLYTYVRGDPLNWRDPEGTEAIAAIGGLFIGAVSGWAGAKAAGGGATEQLVGLATGALSGAAIGALDPTGGVLTAGALLKGAVLNGVVAGWSNFAGQAVTMAITGNNCLNFGSMWGSMVGGALGGTMNRVLAASSVAQNAAAGIHGVAGQWGAQWLSAVGMAPAVVGEAIGSDLGSSGRR